MRALFIVFYVCVSPRGYRLTFLLVFIHFFQLFCNCLDNLCLSNGIANKGIETNCAEEDSFLCVFYTQYFGHKHNFLCDMIKGESVGCPRYCFWDIDKEKSSKFFYIILRVDKLLITINSIGVCITMEHFYVARKCC